MKATGNLGDWTRLGIIVSVFWAIGSAYYLTGVNRQAYWQSASKDCLALQKAPPPGFNLWACGADNRAQWQGARRRAWDGVALRSLGPIPLAWLFAYACVRLARRIRAGFRHARGG
jgi:hypothetical protein